MGVDRYAHFTQKLSSKLPQRLFLIHAKDQRTENSGFLGLLFTSFLLWPNPNRPHDWISGAFQHPERINSAYWKWRLRYRLLVASEPFSRWALCQTSAALKSKFLRLTEAPRR